MPRTQSRVEEATWTGSRSERGLVPTAVLPLVEDAAMEPVLAPFPELDGLRNHPESRPEFGARDALLRELPLPIGEALLELSMSSRKRLALRRRIGSDLMSARARRPVCVRFLVRDLHGASFHAHLPGERRPVEAERGERRRAGTQELASLAAGQVREEDEAGVIDAAEQPHAPRGRAVRSDGPECGGRRLRQGHVSGRLEPVLEEGDRILGLAHGWHRSYHRAADTRYTRSGRRAGLLFKTSCLSSPGPVRVRSLRCYGRGLMNQLPIWSGEAPPVRSSIKALSKSRVIAGLQCHKRLYLETYEHNKRDPFDDSRKALIDAARQVGVAARSRYPGGVLMPDDPLRHEEAVRATREAMRNPSHPAVYEAAFTFDDIRVRVDIMSRAGEHWDIVEVKS